MFGKKLRNHILPAIDERATAATRTRYDRLAPIYDRMQRGMERRLAPLRAELWHLVRGPTVLEIGVGTGNNMAHYPPDCTITAVDLSPRIIKRREGCSKPRPRNG